MCRGTALIQEDLEHDQGIKDGRGGGQSSDFNSILHSTWIKKHTLTFENNPTKCYFGEKSNFLHSFLKCCPESRKVKVNSKTFYFPCLKSKIGLSICVFFVYLSEVLIMFERPQNQRLILRLSMHISSSYLHDLCICFIFTSTYCACSLLVCGIMIDRLGCSGRDWLTEIREEIYATHVRDNVTAGI